MLLTRATLNRIATGEVTLIFRRWQRPTVQTGGTLRTAIGVLEIRRVVPIALASIRAADAQQAGYTELGELLSELEKRPTGQIYRIEIALAGPDPRTVLRDQTDVSADDLQAIFARLEHLDATSAAGPWTKPILDLIAAQPGTRAGELATATGRDKERLKRDIRKLKELGLTESLLPGYRLAPRGQVVLDELNRRKGPGR